MADQDAAENVIDALYEMQHVDCYDLAVYAFDQLSEKDRDKFAEMIMENYELYTLDQACEALNDAKSI